MPKKTPAGSPVNPTPSRGNRQPQRLDTAERSDTAERRISRRGLPAALAGLSAGLTVGGQALLLHSSAAPAHAAEGSYTGALDGHKEKLNMAMFDSQAYSLRRYSDTTRKLAFRAKNKGEALQWQKQLRAKVTELLGGFPTQGLPPNGELLEQQEFDTYTRFKYVLESRPGMMVLAYKLVPKNVAKGPNGFPAVICIPGHGRGVDDLVGIDDKGKPRFDKSGYQHDFALQTVEAGMVALAIEPLGFGCRRDEKARSRNLGTSSCQPSAGAALLLGETMVGWRTYDVMRTIDYFSRHPEVDPNRIGCMGISGGGTITTFASALDPRIKAAFVSGYLNTFKDSILSLSHCIDNYVPGILQWAEMYDVGGLIAPRPLIMESGMRDNIFPIAASKLCYQKLQEVYTVFGAADRVQQHVFDDEHTFNGAQGIPFLKKHL